MTAKAKPAPRVAVTAYGNNGQKFTQLYAATEPGDWELLTLVKPDQHVQALNEEVREKFDAAVTRAVKMEHQYH